MQRQSPERQRVSYWHWMHTVTWLLHLQSQKHIGYFDHKLCHFSSLHAIFLLLQGFKAIIDTKNEYPLTSRDPILIKAGQVVLIKVEVCYHSYIYNFILLYRMWSAWEPPRLLRMRTLSPSTLRRDNASLTMSTLLITLLRPTRSIPRLKFYPLVSNSFTILIQCDNYCINLSRHLACLNARSTTLLKCWGMQTDACRGGCPHWTRMCGCALPMRPGTSAGRSTRSLRMCAR